MHLTGELKKIYATTDNKGKFFANGLYLLLQIICYHGNTQEIMVN